MCARLVRGGAPGTSPSGQDDASDKASAMLQVGLATLSLLVDDGRASEFAYNTDIALLQARTGTFSGGRAGAENGGELRVPAREVPRR